MNKATWQIDDREFQDALKKFQSTSRKAAAENVRDQAKLLVKAFVQLTPPNKEKSNKKGDFQPSYNKGGGQRTIRADLGKIFRQSKNGTADAAAFHKRFRDRRGRVHTRLKTDKADRRIKIADLASYKKRVLDRVGYMAAGWKAAAAALGVTLPAWITRHNAKGHGSVRQYGSKIVATLTNSTVYPGSRNLIERRVDNALRFRARTMMSRVNRYVYKAAKQAGFDTRGSA